MIVRFHDAADDAALKFAVIIARHRGKWVFCKHRERESWELPGGHREPGEDILRTAKRELFEETGALQYTIAPVCAYSVTGQNRANPSGKETFGMLFFADVESFAPGLHSEIERIDFFDAPPEKLTYPLIQPALMHEFEKRSR